MDPTATLRVVLGAFAVAVACAVLLLATTAVSVPPPTPCGLECGMGPSWGQPLNLTGNVSVGCPEASGHYCYSIEIAGTGYLHNISSFFLSLRNATGAAVPWPGYPGDTVSLISPLTSQVCAVYDTQTGNWSLNESYSGDISGGYTVVIYTGGIGPAFGLKNLEIVWTGVNGVSGVVPSNPFP
jgi:hypothetical protein